ncbi:MAG: hypothetical protein R3D85_04935 [Paracoccaceae bacterium]
MDDRAATLLRQDVLEAMADGDERDLVGGIASYLSDDDTLGPVDGRNLRLAASLPRFPISTGFCNQFDLPPGFDEDTLAAQVFTGGEAGHGWRQLSVPALLSGSAQRCEGRRKAGEARCIRRSRTCPFWRMSY